MSEALPVRTLEQRVDALVGATTEYDVLLSAADIVLDVRHELETLRLALSRVASELLRRAAEQR